VVNDFARCRVDDAALDRLDVAIFFQVERGRQRAVEVRSSGRHLEVRVTDHEIRRADPPGGDVLFLRHRRHVGRVALRRSGVDPLDDGGDLLVAQRRIVLVLLDANRLVEEPRRHLALADALLDRTRPWPRVLVRQQRHRRDLVRTMAAHTRAIQNRRNVFAEGDLRRRLRALRAERRRTAEGDDGRAAQRHDRREYEPPVPNHLAHGTLLFVTRERRDR
jgi:hypothetical protein